MKAFLIAYAKRHPVQAKIAFIIGFVGLLLFPGDRVLLPGDTHSASAQVSNPCSISATSTGPTGLSMPTYGGSNCTWSQNGIQSFVRTYKYSSLGNTPASATTDLFTISGSATKTIRVAKIVVGGANSSSAAQFNPVIIRRQAADVGGTFTNPTPLPRDLGHTSGVGALINEAGGTLAPTATLTLYTANPTSVGATTAAGMGTIDSCRLLLNTTTTVPDVCVFAYGVNDDQMTVLRGVNDVLAINFAAATSTNDLVDLDVEWVEE